MRKNKRLQHGYDERIVSTCPESADLWIQAASVGESYLALEILQALKPANPLRVLVTTNTQQGMEVLQAAQEEINSKHTNITIKTGYFPFDQPSLMDKAVKAIQPKILLLLESELWPGLLKKCLSNNVKVMVANGRMTEKSIARYMIWPTFWKDLRPDKILAMSKDDSHRFSALFGEDIVETMDNIKFDRLGLPSSNTASNPLAEIIDCNSPFLVLGSIRQEEESDIVDLLVDITNEQPQAIIGLFPRHMHRLDFWKNKLSEKSLSWRLRSEIVNPVKNGEIVLWDTMGELLYAYGLAQGAFVGGSLAPVGGQNFLEPLTCGIRPVIGPSWFNFYWIGKEIFEQKLVFQVNTWQDVSELLQNNCTTPTDREKNILAVRNYVQSRQGGTQHVCSQINNYLLPGKNK